MMAYDYACRLPGRVAAIGVVASAYVSGCTPRRAVPVMHVHGTQDPVLPIDGGYSARLRGRVPSMIQTDAVFKGLDQRAGTPARNVYLAGAGHAWPRPGWQGGYRTTEELFSYLWRYQR
jgi:polyhydroxybutyrate depolymerase